MELKTLCHFNFKLWMKQQSLQAWSADRIEAVFGCMKYEIWMAFSITAWMLSVCPFLTILLLHSSSMD